MIVLVRFLQRDRTNKVCICLHTYICILTYISISFFFLERESVLFILRNCLMWLWGLSLKSVRGNLQAQVDVVVLDEVSLEQNSFSQDSTVFSLKAFN